MKIASGLVLVVLALAGGARPAARPDALDAEISRWSTFANDTTATDEFSRSVKPASATALAQAQAALRAGRRGYALQRLAAVRADLGAVPYVLAHGEGAVPDSVFESEWERVGRELGAGPAAPDAGRFPDAQAADVRATGEAALAQVRHYYEASLEYGRSTMPAYGLFYLGSALAQRDFVTFCRALGASTARRAPPLRSIAPELDALQTEMLAAYRPPASIDRHREFIGASSALKEARELDARGLRYGALLRYLQAVARTSPLLGSGDSLGRPTLARQLAGFETRLERGNVDHGIGRLFLEIAAVEMEGTPGTSPPLAAAIARDVLPRYFRALEPARPAAPAATPEVTVTLVRWPFT